MFLVAKSFRTAFHRFAVGATVSVDDVAGPVPVDRLIALGHITSLPPPADAPVLGVASLEAPPLQDPPPEPSVPAVALSNTDQDDGNAA